MLSRVVFLRPAWPRLVQRIGQHQRRVGASPPSEQGGSGDHRPTQTDLIEQHADTLAELESLNNGKPRHMARSADVEGAIRFTRYMAGWATKIEGNTRNLSSPGAFGYTLKEPVGVVAAIVPWNFPLSMALWKLAPALATGCTVVLKPAELTPLSALYLAQLIAQAGYPAGVVNVVTGDGADAGAALANHPDINKIAFTGSTLVGKKVGMAALSNMTRMSLELGGKSPVIICADADIDKAAQGAADAIFFNQGQVCCAGSRLYIHADIYQPVLKKLAHIANNLKLGLGLDDKTQMGPLISALQKSRVQHYVDLGQKEVPDLVTGGQVDGLGHFFKPTIFANTNNAMRIVQEEIFGPVVCAQPFTDTNQALTLANDSQYGLGASVWTQNLDTAHHFSRELHAGLVWINTHNLVDACMPFGGVKGSGFGREQGKEQLEHYLETKSVWIQS